MPVPVLAAGARTLLTRYSPQVMQAAKRALAQATSGKVTDAADIPKYVGSSSQRMTVVGDALVRSGVAPDEVFPLDIVQSNPQMMAARTAAMALGQQLAAQFAAGADKVVPGQSSTDIAADVIRLKRVKAVLSIYGSETNYFLCHPNGGVPPADFAYAKAVSIALR
jgi:hypothetical protein